VLFRSGTLKLCVFRTWQKSHSVYVSVSVPVDGVALLCGWFLCDCCDCSHTLTNGVVLLCRWLVCDSSHTLTNGVVLLCRWLVCDSSFTTITNKCTRSYLLSSSVLQHGQCRTPYAVCRLCLVLLMMGIMMPETC
jgi:hypothetical protein